MKLGLLIETVGRMPFFDLPLLVQTRCGSKRTLVVQLHRWAQRGEVIRLRRGLYTLAESYRKPPLPMFRLANEIYRPSYISGLTAMSYYGLIPEKVVPVTSVTTRVTRTFKNPLGIFAYASLKRGGILMEALCTAVLAFKDTEASNLAK